MCEVAVESLERLNIVSGTRWDSVSMGGVVRVAREAAGSTIGVRPESVYRVARRGNVDGER